MRVRGVYIRGHKYLPDLQVNFQQFDGTESHGTEWVTSILGPNGSGKSIISQAIACAFAGSVREEGAPCTVSADLVRVDFEVDNAVIAAQSFRGRFDRHSAIAARFDSKGKHGVLMYDRNRLAMDVPGNYTGLKVVVPILADLHLRSLEDSVVVIDDFDLGLDASLRGKFFKHLRSHLRPRRNQLILTAREKIGEMYEVVLPEGRDVMEDAMREVSLLGKRPASS